MRNAARRRPKLVLAAAVRRRFNDAVHRIWFNLVRGVLPMGLLKEFKEFALRGNAIDLAVGVIIGGAFNKITTSLVNDVIMPPIGKVLSLGGKAASFKDWYVPLFDAKDAALAKLPENYTLTDIQAAKLPVFAYG
jgi:large conductance mechanosensitive channel